MPERREDRLVTVIRIAFAAAFALLILSFTWALSANRATIREAARQHAHQYSEETRRIAGLCRDQPPSSLGECVLAAVEATREDQRAEHELAAQREVADWTLLMLVMSGFGLLVSGFGLLALLRTIRQGKQGLERAHEANLLAADTAARQLRAYLVVKTFRLQGFKVKHRPVLSYKVCNTGQTPAHQVRILAQQFQAPSQQAGDTKVRFLRPLPPVSNIILGPGQEVDLELHFFEPLSAAELSNVLRDGTEIGVFGIISYRDIYRRRHFTTFKMFLRPQWIAADGSSRMAGCQRGNRST